MKTVREYIEENTIKKGSIDKTRANSLLRQSKSRIKDLKTLPLNSENAPFRFEDGYEAIREILQAFMFLEGLTPYSHEATIAFAKERKLMNEKEVSKTDRYRKIRNDINYRGETVTIETTKEVIKFSSKLIKTLEKKFKKVTK